MHACRRTRTWHTVHGKRPRAHAGNDARMSAVAGWPGARRASSASVDPGFELGVRDGQLGHSPGAGWGHEGTHNIQRGGRLALGGCILRRLGEWRGGWHARQGSTGRQLALLAPQWQQHDEPRGQYGPGHKYAAHALAQQCQHRRLAGQLAGAGGCRRSSPSWQARRLSFATKRQSPCWPSSPACRPAPHTGLMGRAAGRDGADSSELCCCGLSWSRWDCTLPLAWWPWLTSLMLSERIRSLLLQHPRQPDIVMAAWHCVTSRLLLRTITCACILSRVCDWPLPSLGTLRAECLSAFPVHIIQGFFCFA